MKLILVLFLYVSLVGSNNITCYNCHYYEFDDGDIWGNKNCINPQPNITDEETYLRFDTRDITNDHKIR